MNKLTRRAALAILAALILNTCPSTRTSPPTVASDQTMQLPQPQPSRPEATIGLALGGGVSKDFAHTGAIKVLKENGVPVKVATSTSAGFIVSSLYASGVLPDRLGLEAEILDKINSINLTLSTSGFIKGEKLQNYISYKVGNHPIQQFPLKFAAVATDFETGKTVTFNHDNADQAVRASASIPSVFQFAVTDSRKYADGDLLQPVPASAARVQDTSFVIAVDTFARPTKNVNQSFLPHLSQTLNITSTFVLRNELGKTDIVVGPKVLGLSSVGGFDQKNHAIQLDEQAVRAVLPKVKRKLAAYRC